MVMTLFIIHCKPVFACTKSIFMSGSIAIRFLCWCAMTQHFNHSDNKPRRQATRRSTAAEVKTRWKA